LKRALGRSLQAIVLQNAEMTVEIMAALTGKKLGQAALFVPGLGRFVGRVQNGKFFPTAPWLGQSTRCDAAETFQPLVRQLLRDVAIFEDLNQALRCKKTSPHLPRLHWRGNSFPLGESFSAAAAVPRMNRCSNAKSRISMLNVRILRFEHATRCAAPKRDEAKTKAEKAAHDLEEFRAKHQAADLARSTSKSSLTIFERELSDVAQKIDTFMAERSTLVQQLDSADAKIGGIETELETVRASSRHSKIDNRPLKPDGKKAAKDEETRAEKLTELRLAVGGGAAAFGTFDRTT